MHLLVARAHKGLVIEVRQEAILQNEIVHLPSRGGPLLVHDVPLFLLD